MLSNHLQNPSSRHDKPGSHSRKPFVFFFTAKNQILQLHLFTLFSFD